MGGSCPLRGCCMMSIAELRDRQSMSLEFKIRYSTLKIQEWYEHFNGQVCVSKSGLDSVVLLDLVRSVYPDVPAVFVDTGQENATVVDHNKSVPNCIFIKPKKNFYDVVQTHGYPVISKLVSRYLSDLQNPNDRNHVTRKLRLTGIRGDGTRGNSVMMLPQIYRYLINSGYRFSDICCKILKKKPLMQFQKEFKLYPYIGTMAVDSQVRELSYLKSGCNAFDACSPCSTPISIWTRQDILEYASAKSLPYPACYGSIISCPAGLKTTGEQSTGCEACLFGIRQDPLRIERIKTWSPARYNFFMDSLNYRSLVPLLISPQMDLFGGAL